MEFDHIASSSETKMEDKLTTSSTIYRDFFKLQQSLKITYSDIRIPQPPNIKTLNETFIYQNMEKICKYKKYKAENVQLTHLFQSDNTKPVTRILIQGDSGFGKTNLVYKLANDWANGADYISSKFHLVILISLTEVKAQTLEDFIFGIIHRAIGKISMTRKDLNSYFVQHKVLLLLDGYDEISVEGESNFKDILVKHELQFSCILVTSSKGIFTNDERYEQSMSSVLSQKDDNMECEFWDKKIQLKGLTAKQRQQLIIDHFEVNSETLQVVEELFSRHANEMFRFPLLVYWFGSLIQKTSIDQMKTKTKTDFYKGLLNLTLFKTMLRENIMKETDTFDIFAPTNDHGILHLRNQVQFFGKKALQRLFHQNVPFTEKDLKNFSGTLLMASDFLVKYTSITQNEQNIRFHIMHRSFVEFFAALTVSNAVQNNEISFEEFQTFVAYLINQQLGPASNSLFFPFLASFMGESAYWIFDALLPWSAIYNVCQPEMMDVLVEITDINDNIIQSLVKFIPPCYEILRSSPIAERYYASECHKKIFQTALERKLISVLDWDLSVLYPLPVESFEVQRLRLRPPDDSEIKITSEASINCCDLMCYIEKDVTTTLLDSYLTVISNINAKHYHLDLQFIQPTTLTMILLEILQGQWKRVLLQRIRLSRISLQEIHVIMLEQLVNSDRIKKGIYLTLHQMNLAVSAFAMSRLWEAVIRSSSIDEFNFLHSGTQINPVFDFSIVSDGIRKIPFQMMSLNGNCRVKYSRWICCIKSIQELMLRNLSCSEVDLINLLKTFRNVEYFECNSQLFLSCLSNKLPFVSSLTELHLHIYKDVSLPFSSAVVRQLVSLQAVTLNVVNLPSESIPQSVDDFIVALLNGRKLQFLGFHSIPSTGVLVGLMNTLLKIKRDVVLFCLELTFTCNMELAPRVFIPARKLLRKKQLKHVAIIDIYLSAPLRSVLPVLFSETEFQFKLKIMGYEEQHSMRNRQWFERFFLTCNRFEISLKNQTIL